MSKPNALLQSRQHAAELAAKLAATEGERDRARIAFNEVKARSEALFEAEKSTRSQFNDLKERLLAAETSNQEMRGYIKRVQEDDVVREELVTVGEVGGDQRFVPKRKSTEFARPSDYTRAGHDYTGMAAIEADFGSERRQKPKNWITY